MSVMCLVLLMFRRVFCIVRLTASSYMVRFVMRSGVIVMFIVCGFVKNIFKII